MPDFIAKNWKAIFSGVFTAVGTLLGYNVHQEGVPGWVSILTGVLMAIVGYALTWIKANKKDTDPRILMLEKALEAMMRANQSGRLADSTAALPLPSGDGSGQQPDFTGDWLPPARKTSAATAGDGMMQPAWLTLRPVADGGNPAAADYQPPVPTSGLCAVGAT